MRFRYLIYVYTNKVGGENIVSGNGNPFLLYTTKNLGDRGRSEEQRHYAVNSKQKLTENLFLVSSFLIF